MSLNIEVRPAALRALREIDPEDRARVQGAIALLGPVPRPPGARALRGRDALRVQVGRYRVIYTVEDEVLLVAAVLAGRGATEAGVLPCTP